VVLATFGTALLSAPPGRAETLVSYEVFSADIGSANIEYFDGVRRQSLQNVPLPWRTTVNVAQPTSVGFDTAEIRADWRWAAAPNRWVTTRVYFGDQIRCENTLDVGNATCYGTTGFNNS
jgi:hypothetical protein